MKSLLRIGLLDQEQVVRLTGQLSRAFEAVFLLLDKVCQGCHEITLAVLVEVAFLRILEKENGKHTFGDSPKPMG